MKDLSHKVRINITLDEDLLAQVDLRAKQERINRSAWISSALQNELTMKTNLDNIKNNRDMYTQMILDLAEGLKK